MNTSSLFPKDRVVGIFRGFSEGGLEFHADIVLPYKNEFQSIPMHGQFLLVQLAHEDEGVLGRITSFFSDGKLASGTGEDYGLRVVAEDRSVPEDLREQYLKYRVNIRVLGVLRRDNGSLIFVASHRRLPHVGSRVAFPSEDILREITGHNLDTKHSAEIGFFALGEFIYAKGDCRLNHQPWMQVIDPCIVPRFDITSLVSRRTFVFARAGFGKSNLTKLLFSNLYKETPTVEKRGGRHVPVGTVIFDPEGEYFWPDDKNRPGLCDVPELEDKIVVFTPKQGPSPFYQSFVAGDIRLDIRRLRPSDVISIALSPERQDQQNVRKLKGMRQTDWEKLVDEIHMNGNAADLINIKHLLQLDNASGDVEAVAARSNMTQIVRQLHDPSSRMMDMLLTALRTGKLCIVDVSQMRGEAALILSGLILRRIFDTNQEEFTKAEPRTIPTIAVIEEAQTVLGASVGDRASAESAYIAWVKEGRKYDLGAMLITQQPGSISPEILSQGDNWFIFHLLSSGDLQALRKANAHFSEDLLSALLNEPITGHGVFWSSVAGRAYPIPIRILSFEDAYKVRDPNYTLPSANTYAANLRRRFEDELTEAVTNTGPIMEVLDSTADQSELLPSDYEPSLWGAESDIPVDTLALYRARLIKGLKSDQTSITRLRSQGMPYKGVMETLKHFLPNDFEDADNFIYNSVPIVLDSIFGKDGWRQERRPSKSKSGGTTAWVIAKK
jgi:Helicase HerA, central domain